MVLFKVFRRHHQVNERHARRVERDNHETLWTEHEVDIVDDILEHFKDGTKGTRLNRLETNHTHRAQTHFIPFWYASVTLRFTFSSSSRVIGGARGMLKLSMSK